MALTTVVFCDTCKWRSSENPIKRDAAGAPCPKCGCGVSALHFDPTYTGVDLFGRPYVEATAADAHLALHGVSHVKPANVALPEHAHTTVVTEA